MTTLALAGSILAFLLSGCTPSFYGYERIRVSDQHISEEVREAIVNDGLTREQVIEQLGEPNGTNDEVHSIGYSRCIRSTGWSVFGPGSVDSCQRVVFRFDAKGVHALRTRASLTAAKMSPVSDVHFHNGWRRVPSPRNGSNGPCRTETAGGVAQTFL